MLRTLAPRTSKVFILSQPHWPRRTPRGQLAARRGRLAPRARLWRAPRRAPQDRSLTRAL